MLTQCPHCQTLYRVSRTQLNAAQGIVRCSGCRRVFNALEHLTSESGQQAEGTGLDKRSHASGARGSGLLRQLAWGTLGLAFLGLLAAQIAWSERDLLAQNPSLRPWLDAYCARTGCTLPALRDVRAIAIVASDLRTLPQSDALLLNVSLRNDADFPQPPPPLRVRLLDAQQLVVGSRVFKPREYLPPSLRGIAIQRDQVLQAVLELEPPARGSALGYEVDIP